MREQKRASEQACERASGRASKRAREKKRTHMPFQRSRFFLPTTLRMPWKSRSPGSLNVFTTCQNPRTHSHAHVHTHKHTHTHKQTHTHKYAHTHIYAHSHTHTLSLSHTHSLTLFTICQTRRRHCDFKCYTTLLYATYLNTS